MEGQKKRLVWVHMWACLSKVRYGVSAQCGELIRLNETCFLYQAWLAEHGPFTTIVDAANVAFFGQNYDEGDFQFSQIGDVVETLSSEDSDDKALVVSSSSN